MSTQANTPSPNVAPPGANSLLSESDIGRLALHSYLMANDPLSVRTMKSQRRTRTRATKSSMQS
jgi:hypothetical protein